jgi:hypothetical protein
MNRCFSAGDAQLTFMASIPKQHRQDHIWYASYGSNLNYKGRFLCYIVGGTPLGAKKRNEGCRDKALPLDNRGISLNFELYFADYSSSWKGAVAFIKQSETSKTLGRMYLITDDQFNDVVLQENAKKVDGRRMVPEFNQLCQEQDFLLADSGLYGRLLRVGEEDGYPIFTFTATKNDLKVGAPSEAYVRVIVSGIKETYPAMTDGEICEYLWRCQGIYDAISPQQLKKWVEVASLK